MRDGWVETKLGSLILINTGKLDVNAASEFGEYPFFTCSRETYRIDEAAFDGESVLVAGNGDLNVKFYDGKFNAYQRTYVLNSIDKNVLDNRFLFIYMQTYINYLRSETRGTVIQYLKKGQFTDAKINLPPLAEQKRIVDLISSVDLYIEALQQELESAKKSRNAVLHELLTAVGEEWFETTLGEICTDGLFGDGDWVESKDQDPEGDYRLLQLADIGDGNFLNKSDRWMNQEQFMRLGCTKLEINDVLIARMPDPIGRACLFPEGLPVCATVVDVAIVRTGNETLQKFLVLLINSSDFRTEAFSLLTGTTRQRISRGNLAKITFAIPSPEKQLEIVNLISLFDSQIARTTRVIEEAKQTRSGLLSDLLSGDHEIPASYDKVIGAAS
jgi:type I restriction enzyme S subunit